MGQLLTESFSLSVALQKRDAYTESHGKRVESLSVETGIKCGLSALDLKLLRVAAKLHDVGKIGIPDCILLKPSSFDANEWEVMKTHSNIGENICQAIPHIHAEAVAKIVRHHHEYFNGEGYPDKLSGDSIPVSARIISVVDAYDAMTTTRPYHQARTHDQVMEIIENDCGRKIDPIIFKYFQTVILKSEHRAHH